MGRFSKWRKRAVCYHSNYGNEWSRSRNAQIAEDEGRFPRTRAAKKMGISVDEFKRLQAFADYYPHEYHHVGKYATEVKYYDPAELERRIEERWKEIDEIYSTDL